MLIIKVGRFGIVKTLVFFFFFFFLSLSLSLSSFNQLITVVFILSVMVFLDTIKKCHFWGKCQRRGLFRSTVYK